MNWAGKQHPLEMLVEWIAPLPLATAVAWAMRSFGFGPVALLVASVPVFAAGVVIVKKAGRENERRFRFEMLAIDPTADPPWPDELLLEEKDAVLELDDPLEKPEPDSRVVRLFARPELTPGELVDRIADFLGEGSQPASPAGPPTPPGPPVDASAALHAALANIRSSLR